MSEFAINIPGGESRRLKTGGKYCPADILVTAESSIIPEGDWTDPNYVYAVTRPKDWLPMPVPNNQEMYFLGHLMESADNQFVVNIYFSGSCVAEFGNLVNGVFVAKESVNLVSNQTLYHALNYEDYGDETTEGYRQYLVRIAGSKITDVYGVTGNIYDTPAFVVDYVCGIPLTGCFRPSGSAVAVENPKTFIRTQYIRFVGEGMPGVNSLGFTNCYSLKAVVCEKPANVSYFGYCFTDDKDLTAFSPNLANGKTLELKYAFRNSGIITFPNMELNAKEDMSFAFSGSSLGLFSGEKINTAEVTSMKNTFSSCLNLREVNRLDISSLVSTDNCFKDCFSLMRLTFAGDATPGGFTIQLNSARLSHKALVEMINSLPTATNAATITITNNPGAAALTDAEIAVATAKNWTVTI